MHARDPLGAGTDARARYTALAQQIVTLRDKDTRHNGVLNSVDDLRGVVPEPVLAAV